MIGNELDERLCNTLGRVYFQGKNKGYLERHVPQFDINYFVVAVKGGQDGDMQTHQIICLIADSLQMNRFL
jgi:hypothetical protein